LLQYNIVEKFKNIIDGRIATIYVKTLKGERLLEVLNDRETSESPYFIKDHL
jgi:hypothetical protein